MITKAMQWCPKCATRTMYDKVRSGVYKCRYCSELGRAVPLHVLKKKDIDELWRNGGA